MKKTTLLLTSFILLSSCYSYRAYDPNIDGPLVSSTKEPIRSKPLPSKNKIILDIQSNKKSSASKKKQVNPEGITENKIQSNLEIISVKSIIKDKGYYKLKVLDNNYKIQAIKWEGDTLYAYKKGKPKKEYKFSEKDIEDLKIRKFSKGRSDILTVASYVAGGVGVFLLLK